MKTIHHEVELAKSILCQAAQKHTSVLVATPRTIQIQNGRGELSHMNVEENHLLHLHRDLMEGIGKIAGFKKRTRRSVLVRKLETHLGKATEKKQFMFVSIP